MIVHGSNIFEMRKHIDMTINEIVKTMVKKPLESINICADTSTVSGMDTRYLTWWLQRTATWA